MSEPKNYKDLRIIFMGTPEFAVASLDVLLKAGCNIIAVVTAPDKPAGRGMELQQSAIKKYAVAHGLVTLQPEKMKNSNFISELQTLRADLQICVAFRMMPQVVWSMPPMGTINLHGSLLPQYRGAAPINWAVINGEKQTGVTTFRLKHDIDTGNILLQQNFPIEETDTAGTVHDKMKEIGAKLLLQTVKELAEGNLQEKLQIDYECSVLKHAPKIFTETCQLHFNQPLENVYNMVRGLSPYPTAFTFLNGKKLKIFNTTKDFTMPDIACGEYKTDGRTYLSFACTNGYLQATEVQLEGKRKMLIEDFLRGYRFEEKA